MTGLEGVWLGACQGHGALCGPVSTVGGQQPPEGALSPLCPTQAVLKRGLKPSCTVIPLMKKDHADNLQFFLSHVGQLHLAG